jgi:glutamine amidotransferase
VRIAVIDYRAGNLASVAKALAAVGAEFDIVQRPAELSGASGVVIPGVGHFEATKTLDEEWRSRIAHAIRSRIPVLGICLGMHWLFEGSDEAPLRHGLGVFSGRCARLTGPVKIPHVGWNALQTTAKSSRLLSGLPVAPFAYFTHAYAAIDVEDAVASTTHGVPFTSVVERDLVFGTQFHPEKSGATGRQILASFVRIVEEADGRC